MREAATPGVQGPHAFRVAHIDEWVAQRSIEWLREHPDDDPRAVGARWSLLMHATMERGVCAAEECRVGGKSEGNVGGVSWHTGFRAPRLFVDRVEFLFAVTKGKRVPVSITPRAGAQMCSQRGTPSLHTSTHAMAAWNVLWCFCCLPRREEQKHGGRPVPVMGRVRRDSRTRVPAA